MAAGAQPADPAQPIVDPAQRIREARQAVESGDEATATKLTDQLLAQTLPPDVRAEALLARCLIPTNWPIRYAAAQEALQLNPRGSVHGELVLCRGNALENMGRLNEAEAEYTAGLREAEQLGDQKLLALALLHLAYIRYFRGDFSQAVTDAQRAFSVSEKAGLGSQRREALENIAHIYSDARVGQYDKATEYYRRLLPEYRAAGEKAQAADTLFNLGSTAVSKKDFAAALVWYRQALAAETELGRKEDLEFVKRSIGICLQRLNRDAEAVVYFDEALSTALARKDPVRIHMILASRAVAYRKLGRVDEATRDLEASRQFFSSTHNERFLEQVEADLALTYAEAGDWQKAFEARTAQAKIQQTLADRTGNESTARLRVQFDLQREEQQNRALEKENEHRARLLDASARIRRLQTIVLVLGGLVIVALALLAVKIRRDGRLMRVMAMTDELTRLPNRRHFLAEAEQQLARAKSEQGTFSLVAFDIDFFKRINDTWGHAAGDVVLQRVAHVCRMALRPNDRIGRTGGEEFTVLLPGARLEDARVIGERLRLAVQSIDCSDLDPAIRVTISLGAAEWTHDDLSVAALASRADAVLYRAKELGRNRLELASA
jgi:diguanylate cyclase (GGDEF)-like protein